jgi:hypothetical protein
VDHRRPDCHSPQGVRPTLRAPCNESWAWFGFSCGEWVRCRKWQAARFSYAI